MEPIQKYFFGALFSASIAARSFAAVLVVCTTALAQSDVASVATTFDTAGPTGPDDLVVVKRRGFQIYRMSSSGSYFTQAMPFDVGPLGPSVRFDSDVLAQTSATLGWSLPGRASELTLIYSPTYNYSMNYPEWNRMNHFFSLHGLAGKPVKKFGRWSLDISAKGDVSNFESFLFTPTALGQSVSSPGTFDDLRDLVSQGQFVSGNLGSRITSVSPIAESPAQLLFYGMQVLTASGVATLKYSYSPRLSLRVGFDGTHFQPLHSNVPQTIAFSATTPTADTAGSGQNLNPVTFRSTAVGANIGMSYSLSPRTTLSMSADSKRIVSPIMDAYSNMASIELNRSLGRRWFVDGRAGVNIVQPLLAVPVPRGLQYIGGGSLGYKRRSHAVVVDVTRSVSESLTFGAGSSVMGSAAWQWQPVRSRWGFDAGVARQTLDGLTAGTFNSWRAHARLSRMIGRQLIINSQYSRLSYRGNLNLQQFYNFDADGVQVSVTWVPLPNLFRR